MEKYIYDQNNGLWYELQGDYYIPCLTLEGDDAPPLGVWGRKRLQHLRKSHEGVYAGLLLVGKLNSHLVEIDAQAAEMFDRLVQQMAAQQGISEQLKAQDQMVWVGAMNNIRNAAEEIVNAEVIFA